MVDSARIIIKAGNGGNGVVHFRRERFIPKGGPDGGDGGAGGSVYIVTDTNLATLEHFAFKQRFEAKNGRAGGDRQSTGASAPDLFLKVPVGTIVRLANLETRELVREIDFDKEGVEVLIAKGGKGGRGNWHFKSSTNTTPMQAETGKPGEEWLVEMELKILADVGLIGLPNVGKSTLLSILTAARPKIANYPFTTLEPNLGVAEVMGKKVVVADIPGLIEGASGGKGLGIRFLQHIERTKVLVHILAGDDVKQLVNDYQTVREELAQYGEEIEKKKEVVVLNKIDLMDEEKVSEVVKALAKKKMKIVPVSGGTTIGLDGLKKEILRLLER